MSRLLKIALGLFGGALVCYLLIALDAWLGLGDFGSYGPGTPWMFLPFIGVIVLFPVSVILLLTCGIRQLFYLWRERAARGSTLSSH